MMFPELDAETVLARTRKCWDLSAPLPLPIGDWLACPVCRAGQPQPRFWRFHIRGDLGHTLPYRCDVSFKCTRCACVWIHGVVLDVEAWERMHRPRRANSQITWRQAREILQEAGWLSP